jgi:hypothetical protein
MFIDILDDFSDVNVEITTANGKAFTGTLKHQTSKGLVIITPTDKYHRFGPAYIADSEVITIREVLPRIEEKYKREDDCEDGPKIIKLSKDITAL